MKPVAVGFVLIAAVSFSAASGLKEAATHLSRKMASAIKHRDMMAFPQAINSQITDDFTYSENGRSMGAKEMEDHMKAGLGMLKSVSKSESHILQVKDLGTKGETRSSHVIKGTLAGPDGKTHTLEMTGISKETWVKLHGKWKLKSMTWVSQKQKMDGLPMGAPQGARGAHMNGH